MNKSFFKREGVKHYQLVHRSLRDPLINDAESSAHVLKEVDHSQPSKRSNQDSFQVDEATLGDAAAYGIYYDDADYNYMQHLRTVGAEANSYLVEAAPAKKPKGKGKRTNDQGDDEGVTFKPVAIPYDALPSHPLDEISYTELTSLQAPVPSLQPDLDPSIREVLEALDDEAYAVDDGEDSAGEDEFWANVIEGGEKDEYYDEEEEEDDEEEDEEEHVDQENDDLEVRVARFKASQRGAAAKLANSDNDEDEISEGGDTIADLRAASARRPPRATKAMSRSGGSQFSMTSSAMFRNEGLQTLDERFEKIEQFYAEDSDSSWGGSSGSDDEDAAPKLVPVREDLDEILDDFLSRYEVLGGKIRPVLEPTAGVEGGAGKLDRIRRELASLGIDDVAQDGEDPERAARRREKESILAAVDRQEREAERHQDQVRVRWEKPKDRWDCETVLSTYSNVSNHPRILRVREGGPRPARIRLDPKTGFPVVELTEEEKRVAKAAELIAEAEADAADDYIRPETVKRSRKETPEERKLRKDSVKVERLARRTEKASTKEAFGSETKRQKQADAKKVANGKAADIKVGTGVRKLA